MTIILIFLATVLIIAEIASASKIKGILKLAARVPVMCTFVAISSVNFGSYIGTETNSTGAMTVNCVLGANYAISLGTGGSGTYNSRHMNNIGEWLIYNLYTDNTHSTIWGNGTGGSVIVNGTGTGSDQNYSIYGRILAGQYVPVGSYADNVVITIDY